MVSNPDSEKRGHTYNRKWRKRWISTYKICELIQGKASHTNHCMHRGTIIAVVICVNPISIFCRHGLAFLLVNRASSLIIMNVAKEYQINLVQSNQKYRISYLDLAS